MNALFERDPSGNELEIVTIDSQQCPRRYFTKTWRINSREGEGYSFVSLTPLRSQSREKSTWPDLQKSEWGPSGFGLQTPDSDKRKELLSGRMDSAWAWAWAWACDSLSQVSAGSLDPTLGPTAVRNGFSIRSRRAEPKSTPFLSPNFPPRDLAPLVNRRWHLILVVWGANEWSEGVGC